jgi:hypothetical protein
MKYYVLVFGSGNPANYTGLSPTFTIFTVLPSVGLTTPPSISEIIVGSGLYQFAYEPTGPIAFLVDGGVALSNGDRYIKGILDPIQNVDEKVGTLSDSFGTTVADPTSMLGYLKRQLEFNEGDNQFAASTGTWSIYNRGSSTALRTKTIVNTSGSVSKTGQ